MRVPFVVILVFLAIFVSGCITDDRYTDWRNPVTGKIPDEVSFKGEVYSLAINNLTGPVDYNETCEKYYFLRNYDVVRSSEIFNGFELAIRESDAEKTGLPPVVYLYVKRKEIAMSQMMPSSYYVIYVIPYTRNRAETIQLDHFGALAEKILEYPAPEDKPHFTNINRCNRYVDECLANCYPYDNPQRKDINYLSYPLTKDCITDSALSILDENLCSEIKGIPDFNADTNTLYMNYKRNEKDFVSCVSSVARAKGDENICLDEFCKREIYHERALINRDANLCKLLQGAYIALCYEEIAILNKDPSICRYNDDPCEIINCLNLFLGEAFGRPITLESSHWQYTYHRFFD